MSKFNLFKTTINELDFEDDGDAGAE